MPDDSGRPSCQVRDDCIAYPPGQSWNCRMAHRANDKNARSSQTPWQKCAPAATFLFGGARPHQRRCHWKSHEGAQSKRSCSELRRQTSRCPLTAHTCAGRVCTGAMCYPTSNCRLCLFKRQHLLARQAPACCRICNSVRQCARVECRSEPLQNSGLAARPSS